MSMTNSLDSLSSSSDSDGPVRLLRPHHHSRSPLARSTDELTADLARLCLRATPPPSRPTSPLMQTVASPVTDANRSLQQLVDEPSTDYAELMRRIQLLAPPLVNFSDRIQLCSKASEFRSISKNRYNNVFAADLQRVCLTNSSIRNQTTSMPITFRI